MSDYIDEPARRTPVRARTQVLVVGGGSAGVAAAVAAARSGADTLLIERSGGLGGLATGGLIILLLTLDAGTGEPVIAGLCQELIDRIAQRGGAFHPPRSEWGTGGDARIEHYRRWGLVWGAGPHRVRYSVAYDPEEARFAMNEMVESSGARLLLHSWACEPIVDGSRVAGVAFHSKSGRFAVLADVVIDASGDGDIGAAAGVPFESERVLPWLWFRMGGVDDVDAVLDAGGWCFRTTGDGQVLLPWGATVRIMRKIDATDPADLTYAELECRKMVMQEVDRLRAKVPQFRRAHLCDIATQIGITESRRLLGEYVLRREDADQPFDDAIGSTGHWTRYGTRYWIPYRALQARGLDNLLAAGRCISVDHRVHHATKEIPACMVSGQAAGSAAALAARAGVGPKQIDVAALQAALRQAGAIV